MNNSKAKSIKTKDIGCKVRELFCIMTISTEKSNRVSFTNKTKQKICRKTTTSLTADFIKDNVYYYFTATFTVLPSAVRRMFTPCWRRLSFCPAML